MHVLTFFMNCALQLEEAAIFTTAGELWFFRAFFSSQNKLVALVDKTPSRGETSDAQACLRLFLVEYQDNCNAWRER